MGGDWIAGSIADFNPRKGHFGLAELRPHELIYDLASLTKIICTATLVAEDFLKSGLSFEKFCGKNLVKEIPEFKGSKLESVTLGEFWDHRSGLPPFLNFTDPHRKSPSESRAQLWSRVLMSAMHSKLTARGESVYSDLGCLMVGLYLERRHQKTLSEQWEAWKKNHSLHAAELRFGVEAKNLSRCVPTETSKGLGEVNDDRAFSLGGIASHAGLFGTVKNVWDWLRAIDAWAKEEKSLKTWLHPEGDRRFFGGWDRPSEPAISQAGEGWPAGVIGHLGYTGTALWWHPASQKAGVLLTNRIYPDDSAASKLQIRDTRRQFFSALWQDKIFE